MPHISYLRVSTTHQGVDGLGIAAQRAAVAAYQPIAEFVEVESGSKSDRTQLAAALAMCESTKSTLVIANLSRLSRSVAFTSALMESGVDFICVDNPKATPLTIHILAAVAEEELRNTSRRTKAALAEARKRGVKLGGYRETTFERRCERATKAAATRRKRVIDAYQHLTPIMEGMRAAGAGLGSIAKHLNEKGHRTTTGKAWDKQTVRRALRRVA